VETRSRFGDLEGDTVSGAIGKGCVVTLVDRKSRMLYAAISPSRDSGLIADTFYRALHGTKVNSITLDRGSEFAKFPEIEKNLDTIVYFADPHSPWQRPSNENINGLLRFFYPKGTDFTSVSEDDFQNVLSLINNRPRKCLGWLSPIEFFSSKCCT
jgi:IS30 family transposase